MPHVVIDYSRNLEGRVAMPRLLSAIRDAMVATGIFPRAGIRVRAVAADHVLIADGNPGHAYLDIVVRIGAGRDGAAKVRALEAVHQAVLGAVGPAMDDTSLMLSVELREIDAILSAKTSSIRRFLPEGQA
jgi:5-carboxymethyl-2-hydroxymuconate isomerase